MRAPSARPNRLLTIAGSDSSGGAGIQADIKAFVAHGGYAMSAITAITAQNTLGVHAVLALPPEIVAAQIDAVFADPGVDAIKIGMLANAGIVEAVSGSLRANSTGIPIVLDPVMISKSGDALLAADAVAALGRLFSRTSLLTPNLPEAERLTGLEARTLAARETMARKLGERCAAVLLKGGHAAGDEVVDLLWDGSDIYRFSHSRLDSRSTHGTGCTLSSAIAARLGRGEALVTAVGGAIDWLHRAIATAPPIGAGIGPVDPFWMQRRSPPGGASGGCLA
ncbi:MAG: bifunctional hydroxymethylpyrimidine kinase/phosphomethylpyrimidine kinase [Thermoanaerobaculia bacterium]